MVTSLLEMKPVELKNLSCDACGSHVIDSFFQSKTIGEKSREAFINRVKVGFQKRIVIWYTQTFPKSTSGLSSTSETDH